MIAPVMHPIRLPICIRRAHDLGVGVPLSKLGLDPVGRRLQAVRVERIVGQDLVEPVPESPGVFPGETEFDLAPAETCRSRSATGPP